MTKGKGGLVAAVLGCLYRIGGFALALSFLGLVATAGLLWAAALVGIQPFATWLQTFGGALYLFFMIGAVGLIIGCFVYGIYHALRHIRAWPQAARSAFAYLTGSSDWAKFVRHGLLPLVAGVFLFLATRRYFNCHFSHSCWSTRVTSYADREAILLVGLGAATLAFKACLELTARFKRQSEKQIQDFRNWLAGRAALRNQQIDATSFTDHHRAILKTERAEIEVILIEFKKRFPPASPPS